MWWSHCGSTSQNIVNKCQTRVRFTQTPECIFFSHSKTDFWKIEKIGDKTRKTQENLRFSGCIFFVHGRWWRWGESNPCPKIHPHGFLRVKSFFCDSRYPAPDDRLGLSVALLFMAALRAKPLLTFTADWCPDESRSTHSSDMPHLGSS